jgi:3-mercaptopyruvate sulfurtransferase SseA
MKVENVRKMKDYAFEVFNGLENARQIVDARQNSDFLKVANNGMENHIINSVNLPYQNLLDESG